MHDVIPRILRETDEGRAYRARMNSPITCASACRASPRAQSRLILSVHLLASRAVFGALPYFFRELFSSFSLPIQAKYDSATSPDNFPSGKITSS